MKKKLSGIRIFILIVAAIATLSVHPVHSAVKGNEKNLYVYFLDVGQGDGAFIRTPSGKNILIDGGQGSNEYDDFDAGKKVVVPFLIRKKITKIDYIVVSHSHNDHIGGLISVMKKYPVGVVYDSGFAYSSPVYTEFLKTIKNKEIKYQIVQKGDVLKWDPDLRVEVFSPKSNRLYDDPNNNSVVLKITYGKVSFLFTGDIEDAASADLLGNYGKKELAAEILKVPHHGSRTSSGVDFLEAVYPEIAVISCGRYNRFRHPHSTVVERYNDFGIELHRTDKEGTVFVATDGDTFTIKSLGIEK